MGSVLSTIPQEEQDKYCEEETSDEEDFIDAEEGKLIYSILC